MAGFHPISKLTLKLTQVIHGQPANGKGSQGIRGKLEIKGRFHGVTLETGTFTSAHSYCLPYCTEVCKRASACLKKEKWEHEQS